MNEFGERSRRGLRAPTRQAGQAGEDGVGLLEADVWNLGAIAGVPAERRPPEPPRVVDQEEDELECVGEADKVELGRRRERHCRIAGVEGAAEAGVGGALRRHEQMFADYGLTAEC